MGKQIVQIDELNDAINGVLVEYNKTVVEGLKKTTKQAMNDLVKNTRETAPVGKRSKHYRDSISSKTIHEDNQGIKKLWFVKGSDYRLTHLLNNGHALKNGGRYPGTNFLGKAVDTIVAWYSKKIEEVLGRNG
jgi:hypothetical protein